MIGHRGAAALAPENTMASFAGGDRGRASTSSSSTSRRACVLGTTRWTAAEHELSLDEVLELLGGARGSALHLDLKQPGYEDGGASRRSRGIGSRSARLRLDRVRGHRRGGSRRAAPALPVAIGYPRDRYGISRLTLAAPADPAPAPPRSAPGDAGCACRCCCAGAHARRAVALHHTLCSRAAVAAAHRRGAPVLGWTANDAGRRRRLLAAGVDGIVSDDPEWSLETAGYTARGVKRLLFVLFVLGFALPGASPAR